MSTSTANNESHIGNQLRFHNARYGAIIDKFLELDTDSKQITIEIVSQNIFQRLLNLLLSRILKTPYFQTKKVVRINLSEINNVPKLLTKEEVDFTNQQFSTLSAQKSNQIAQDRFPSPGVSMHNSQSIIQSSTSPIEKKSSASLQTDSVKSTRDNIIDAFLDSPKILEKLFTTFRDFLAECQVSSETLNTFLDKKRYITNNQQEREDLKKYLALIIDTYKSEPLKALDPENHALKPRLDVFGAIFFGESITDKNHFERNIQVLFPGYTKFIATLEEEIYQKDGPYAKEKGHIVLINNRIKMLEEDITSRECNETLINEVLLKSPKILEKLFTIFNEFINEHGIVNNDLKFFLDNKLFLKNDENGVSLIIKNLNNIRSAIQNLTFPPGQPPELLIAKLHMFNAIFFGIPLLDKNYSREKIKAIYPNFTEFHDSLVNELSNNDGPYAEELNARILLLENLLINFKDNNGS